MGKTKHTTKSILIPKPQGRFYCAAIPLGQAVSVRRIPVDGLLREHILKAHRDGGADWGAP